METIHVLMVSNEGYADLLICCVRSVLLNKGTERYVFHIIDDGISENKKTILKSLINENGGMVQFYTPPRMSTYTESKTCALDKSTFYRLYVGSIIDEEINKILYLDCDIIALQSINSLWNVDVEDYVLAGVQDINIMESRRAVGVLDSDRYINAGVLLINLKQWRENRIEEACIDYLSKSKWSIEFNDQGVINNVCKGHIKIVSPKYNFMMPYFRYKRSQLLKYMDTTFFYTENELQDAISEPVIIHYAGTPTIRPWFDDSKAMYEEQFLTYYNYDGVHALKPQPTDKKSVLRRIIYHFPDNMCLVLIKRWEKYSFKKREKQR